jgi:hypothetical protein
MTKDERSRALARVALATVAAACVALTTGPAAAQDPPPPLLPSEVPQPPPPASPPAPDAPPRPPAPLPNDEPPPLALPPPFTPAPAPDAPVEPPSSSNRPRESRYAASARTLNGHTFPTAFLIDSAFVQTNVGIGVEIGRQWEYGVQPASPASPSPTSSPDSFQYDRALALTTQYLSFGVAVSDRVEIGMSASYSAMVSGDVNAAILFGGRTAWTLTPGARFKLFRSSQAQMALHLYGNFGSSAWQNPALVITEISNEVGQIAGNAGNPTPNPTRMSCLADGNLACALTTPGFNPQTSAYTSQSNFGGGGTLSLAAAFTSSFGLQAALGLEAGYAPSTAGGATFASAPVIFHVGVAPSFDLGPSVPLTLMAEYLLTVTNSSTVSSSIDSASVMADAGSVLTIQNSLVGGVYYTGRRDLVLGLLFRADFAEAQSSFPDDSTGTTMTDTVVQPPLTRLTGQINARYFF